MVKIIVADQVYIPKADVKLSTVKKHYERHLYTESVCKKCDNKPDRFNDICATCPAYNGFYKTWRAETIKGRDYIGVPKGNWRQIKENLGIDLHEEEIDDRRSDVKAKHPLTFTKKLYNGTEIINGVQQANQVGVIRQFWKFKNGLILARPRTGKTVIAVRLICLFKRRTIVIAHERELLRQFIRTVRQFTDIKDVEKSTGRKLVGIIQKESDWDENWDVVLCTYQKFIRNETGLKRLNKHVRKKFGLFIIDEIHRANALTYSKLVTRIDCKYNFGLTATVDRKDNAQFLVEQSMGDVVASVDNRAMNPEVKLHYTKLLPKYEWKGRSGYTKHCMWTSEHKERNILIVRQIFKDLRENPNHCIVIPVLFVAHAKLLVRMINKQARINNEKRDEKWSHELARELLGSPGQSAREQDATLKAARAGTDTRVIVATRKKVAEGTDVMRWTHMYMQFPVNNAPQFYQMTQRICTAYEGKPKPILRMWVDGFGLSLGCFAATWANGVIKQKYDVSEATRKQAYLLINLKKDSVKAMSEWGSGSETIRGKL